MSNSFTRRLFLPIVALLVLVFNQAQAKSGEAILDDMADALIAKVDAGTATKPKPMAGSITATLSAPTLGGVPIEITADYKTRPPMDFHANLKTAIGDYSVRANAQTYALASATDKRYFSQPRPDADPAADAEEKAEDWRVSIKESFQGMRVASVEEVGGAPGGKAWMLDLRPKEATSGDDVERADLYVLQKTQLPWKLVAYGKQDKEQLKARLEYQADQPVTLIVETQDEEGAVTARFDFAYSKEGHLQAIDGEANAENQGTLKLKADFRPAKGISDADFVYSPPAGYTAAGQEEITMLIMTRVMGLAFGAALMQGGGG